ncbi:protein lifeguard 3 isoform X3 [Lates calcarifer]|nr:protein lifeguard 3 isoform X3 [Lates calcarifer]
MFPGPPGYFGREGVYPQAGMWAAPGFSPSGMPTTIPTLSAGLHASNSGDMEDFLSAQWESTSIRHAFIRKVYLILTAQLAVTFSVVAVFTFVDPVRLFVIRYPGIYWASFVVYFLVYCILICCKEPRRRFPWNLVLLGIFTLALSYMCGTISSYYETKAVFLAMGITALVCVAVTIFCFQTKVDFTSCGGLLCIAGILLMIIGIVTAIVLSFQYVPWLHMLYAAIGAIVYTLFLAYNTQLLIGNRELAISPEEYIYGALSLYVDIVHIFLFILQISGAVTE